MEGSLRSWRVRAFLATGALVSAASVPVAIGLLGTAVVLVALGLRRSHRRDNGLTSVAVPVAVELAGP